MTPATDEEDPETRAEAGPRPTARVMVVDDHEFFRSGVTAWIQQQQGVAYSGEAGTLAEARARLAAGQADVLLLDLGLPDGDGLDFIREATALRPGLRVIVLSQRDEAVFAERAIRNGARAYLMKSEASEKLLEAIHAVMDGGTWLSRAIQAQADPLEFSARLRQEGALGELSDRELQVFALIGAGYGPKDIGERLGISAKTVETHREHIRHKLGLKTSAQLTRMAERLVHAGSV